MTWKLGSARKVQGIRALRDVDLAVPSVMTGSFVVPMGRTLPLAKLVEGGQNRVWTQSDRKALFYGSSFESIWIKLQRLEKAEDYRPLQH